MLCCSWRWAEEEVEDTGDTWSVVFCWWVWLLGVELGVNPGYSASVGSAQGMLGC